MGITITFCVGAFCVARFDNQGNAKAFTQWNGQQDWLHVFYVLWCRYLKRLTRSLQGAWPHSNKMVATGRDIKQQIADYFSQSTRNRLVFCHSEIEGLSYVNVGKTLAEALSHEDLQSAIFPYAADDYLSEILSKSECDPLVGQYLALCNIGILFEPSLGFNLKSILDNTSKDKTVVVCSDGYIESDRLYFFQKDDKDFVDLKGLSYMEIK